MRGTATGIYVGLERGCSLHAAIYTLHSFIEGFRVGLARGGSDVVSIDFLHAACYALTRPARCYDFYNLRL